MFPTGQLYTPTIISYLILVLSASVPFKVAICLVEVQTSNLLWFLCEFQDWGRLIATDSQLRPALQIIVFSLNLSSIYLHFSFIIPILPLFLTVKFHFFSHSSSFLRPIIGQILTFITLLYSLNGPLPSQQFHFKVIFLLIFLSIPTVLFKEDHLEILCSHFDSCLNLFHSFPPLRFQIQLPHQSPPAMLVPSSTSLLSLFEPIRNLATHHALHYRPNFSRKFSSLLKRNLLWSSDHP